MLVEKSLNEALKDYVKGKKVIVLQIYENGEMESYDLDSFLNDERNHFLVDVPAYRNPEFEAAVRAMTSNKVKGEQELADSSEAEILSGGGRSECP